MRGTKLNSEHGHVTTTIVSVILMLSVLGVIVASLVNSSNQKQIFEADEQRAFYAAQSGLEYGIKKYVADENEDPDEFVIEDLDLGNGITADVSMKDLGNNQLLFTSVGNTGGITQTLQTRISKTDSGYVPNYAVYSSKPVNNTAAKDSSSGETNAGLVYANAPAVPYFDLNELRAVSKQTQQDGNAYYYEENLTVDEGFSPPDGAVVFVEGKLKFAKGSWPGTVHFVAMDDISFKPTWRLSDDVKMTVYQPDADKKIWVEPANFDDDPVDFDIDEGEVIPSEPYAASVKVIGTALPFGFWFWVYDAPITTSIVSGNDEVFPFGPNPDSGASNLKAKVDDGSVSSPSRWREEILPNEYEAGTSIAVKATSWAWKRVFGRAYREHMSVHSSDPDDAIVVKALRDGDRVPAIEPFGSQRSAADFIAGYIDFDRGRVTLEDNQAIYLFELATRDLLSPSADFQDLVVLVTLAKNRDALAGSGNTGQDENEELEDGDLLYDLNFKGGIISHATVTGLHVDALDDINVISQLNVIHDKQAIKDFLSYSVNGSSRVILSSEWKSVN